MNKKYLILSILPSFLLGGCSGAKLISKEKAAELASDIIVNQKTVEDIEELTILLTKSYSQSSSSTSASTSKKDAVMFQLSKANRFFHFKRSGKNFISEQWTYVKESKLYELSRKSENGVSSATGVYSRFDNDPNFQIVSDGFISGIMMETLLGFSSQLTNLIQNTDAEAQEEGKTSSVSYYSRGTGNLQIGVAVELNNSPYSDEGIEGTATGKSTIDYYWDNSNPSEMQRKSEYLVEVDSGAQTDTYTCKTNSSIFVQYAGTLIDYPDLSNFNIHEKL